MLKLDCKVFLVLIFAILNSKIFSSKDNFENTILNKIYKGTVEEYFKDIEVSTNINDCRKNEESENKVKLRVKLNGEDKFYYIWWNASDDFVQFAGRIYSDFQENNIKELGFYDVIPSGITFNLKRLKNLKKIAFEKNCKIKAKIEKDFLAGCDNLTTIVCNNSILEQFKNAGVLKEEEDEEEENEKEEEKEEENEEENEKEEENEEENEKEEDRICDKYIYECRNNVNKNEVFIIDCGKIPQIKLCKSNDSWKVSISCRCKPEVALYLNLKEYLKKINFKTYYRCENFKYNEMPNHCLIEASYNLENNFYCKKCAEEKKADGKTNDEGNEKNEKIFLPTRRIKYNFKCEEKECNGKLENYCKDCEKYLCKSCSNEKGHNNHEKIRIGSLYEKISKGEAEKNKFCEIGMIKKYEERMRKEGKTKVAKFCESILKTFDHFHKYKIYDYNVVNNVILLADFIKKEIEYTMWSLTLKKELTSEEEENNSYLISRKEKVFDIGYFDIIYKDNYENTKNIVEIYKEDSFRNKNLEGTLSICGEKNVYTIYTDSIDSLHSLKEGECDKEFFSFGKSDSFKWECYPFHIQFNVPLTVKNANYMFSNMQELNKIDGLDKLKFCTNDFKEMFYNTKNLKEIDISKVEMGQEADVGYFLLYSEIESITCSKEVMGILTRGYIYYCGVKLSSSFEEEFKKLEDSRIYKFELQSDNNFYGHRVAVGTEKVGKKEFNPQNKKNVEQTEEIKNLKVEDVEEIKNLKEEDVPREKCPNCPNCYLCNKSNENIMK